MTPIIHLSEFLQKLSNHHHSFITSISDLIYLLFHCVMCINRHLCDPYESVQESHASLCTTLSQQLFHSFSCYSHIVFLITLCLISLILLVFAYCVIINIDSLWSSNTMIFICYTMASKNLHIQSIAYLNRIAYAVQSASIVPVG